MITFNLAKIEDINNLGLVDTLISEPIGVLLVHERMIESYLVARDRFLKPGGAMVPSTGTIYVAPVDYIDLVFRCRTVVSNHGQSPLLGTKGLLWC